MKCVFLDKCPFYNGKLSGQQGVGAIIKRKYCEDNSEACARFRAAMTIGPEQVPDTLFPNMNDLADSLIEETSGSPPRAPREPGGSRTHSYIARQPIFDRNMGVYGYELLYRQGSENLFMQMDDDQATAELIYTSMLVFDLYDLTESTRAFINFSKELIESDIPSLLPKQSITIEVLERSQTTQATIDACRRIKALGYSLALDDFVFNPEDLPLLEFADIVKVDFLALSPEKQAEMIRQHHKGVRFLAEKVETREDYARALHLGYDFFQGHFFSKPSMLQSKEVASLNINLFNILKELDTIDPSFHNIAAIIEKDLGLSLKLLKLANSVYFGARKEIKSILHALSFIGINEMYQWISLMLVKDCSTPENAELIKLSFVRAKFMELLALELYPGEDAKTYYFTGMFSYIDVLLSQPMEQILKGLPLPGTVKQALLGEDTPPRRLLDCVIAYERADFDAEDKQHFIGQIGSMKFLSLYIDAIKWVKNLNY